MRSEAKKRRAYWVTELEKLSGSFGDDSEKMLTELQAEIDRDGKAALMDHLRVCGAMPEQYGHDSSAEKLYSKYTDAVISGALTALVLACHMHKARLRFDRRTALVVIAIGVLFGALKMRNLSQSDEEAEAPFVPYRFIWEEK